MKKLILCGTVALLAGPLLAADSSPKDDVTNAAKKLGDSANYSWHTTVVVPEDAPFKPGPTDGQLEKGGLIYVKLAFGDNTTEFVKKGEAAAMTDQDGNWESLTNVDSSQGPGRFMVGMVRNFQAPDAQAAQVAGFAKELKQDGDAYSSDRRRRQDAAHVPRPPRRRQRPHRHQSLRLGKILGQGRRPHQV